MFGQDFENQVILVKNLKIKVMKTKVPCIGAIVWAIKIVGM
jgi:hypothetical protein